MAYSKVLMFLIASVVGLSECAFVDTLNKCKLHDKDCHKELFQKVIKDIAKPGVPELGIPPIDPMEVKNMKFSILNVLDMTFVEGTVKGGRNCVVNKFEVNLEKSHAYLDITCDLVIKAKYNMKTQGDIIKNVLGGAIHGDGNGKIKIDKANVKLDFPVEVEKRGDDTFLKGDFKKIKYTLEILDKLTFDADNLYLGDKESSKDIVKLMNENWKLLVGSFGNNFLEFALTAAYDFLNKFTSNVPTKYYIIDDLSQYVQ